MIRLDRPDRRPEGAGVFWLTAARSDHRAVVDELIEARGRPPLHVRGRALDRDAHGAAVLSWATDSARLAEGDADTCRATSDRLLAALASDTEAWLLITDPEWLDPTSADVVARVLGGTDRCVAVVSVPGPRSGPVAAAASAVGTGISLEAVDDRALDEAVALFEDDTIALAATVLERTDGVPFLVAALVDDMRTAVLEAPGPVLREAAAGVGPALRTAVTDVVARLPGDLRVSLDRAAATRTRAPTDLLDQLAEEGCIDASGRLRPAVADVVLATASAASRARLVSELGELEIGEDQQAVHAVDAIERLGAAPGDAPRLFGIAARVVAGTDPGRALDWVDRLGPALGPELRLEVLVAAGRLGDATALAMTMLDSPRAETQALARGVEALGLQRSARFDEAAVAYATADPDNVLGLDLVTLAAIPRSLAGGDTPRDTAEDTGRSAAARFAAGAVALRHDLERAVDLMAAAETLVAHGDVTLWPDTPTALAALALSSATRHDEAGRVLASRPTPTGAFLHHARIRAVAGWIALRAGRWADASEVRDELREQPLPLRERFLVAGLDAALAHRLGDHDAMAKSLDAALHLVRRHPMDLGSLLPHMEIALLCTRLGMPIRGTSLLEQLGSLAASVDERHPFHAVVALSTGLAGLVLEDEELARRGCEGLTTAPIPSLRAAGPAIATIAGGGVPAEASEVAWALVEAGLVLEGSLVAGQAALNTTSAKAAGPLLKTGREIRARLPRAGAQEATGVGALSAREVQIATLVSDGHTYKQIGAALFISAKTVEHHVAHIRTKLGASTRAEMLSAIRNQLPR